MHVRTKVGLLREFTRLDGAAEVLLGLFRRHLVQQSVAHLHLRLL